MVKRFFATKKDPMKKSTIVVKEHGLIGRGSEKEVHEVRVIVERKKKQKKLNLALKRFDEIFNHEHPWSNPANQVKNYNFLRTMNIEKKLGLNIIPTFRLIEAPGKTPGIVATKLKVLDWKFLHHASEKVINEVISDMERQRAIVKREGFEIGIDAFVIAKKGDSLVPVIADFKAIRPMYSQSYLDHKLAQIEAHKKGSHLRK